MAKNTKNRHSSKIHNISSKIHNISSKHNRSSKPNRFIHITTPIRNSKRNSSSNMVEMLSSKDSPDYNVVDEDLSKSEIFMREVYGRLDNLPSLMQPQKDIKLDKSSCANFFTNIDKDTIKLSNTMRSYIDTYVSDEKKPTMHTYLDAAIFVLLILDMCHDFHMLFPVKDDIKTIMVNNRIVDAQGKEDWTDTDLISILLIGNTPISTSPKNIYIAMQKVHDIFYKLLYSSTTDNSIKYGNSTIVTGEGNVNVILKTIHADKLPIIIYEDTSKPESCVYPTLNIAGTIGVIDAATTRTTVNSIKPKDCLPNPTSSFDDTFKKIKLGNLEFVYNNNNHISDKTYYTITVNIYKSNRIDISFTIGLSGSISLQKVINTIKLINNCIHENYQVSVNPSAERTNIKDKILNENDINKIIDKLKLKRYSPRILLWAIHCLKTCGDYTGISIIEKINTIQNNTNSKKYIVTSLDTFYRMIASFTGTPFYLYGGCNEIPTAYLPDYIMGDIDPSALFTIKFEVLLNDMKIFENQGGVHKQLEYLLEVCKNSDDDVFSLKLFKDYVSSVTTEFINHCVELSELTKNIKTRIEESNTTEEESAKINQEIITNTKSFFSDLNSLFDKFKGIEGKILLISNVGSAPVYAIDYEEMFTDESTIIKMQKPEIIKRKACFEKIHEACDKHLVAPIRNSKYNICYTEILNKCGLPKQRLPLSIDEIDDDKLTKALLKDKNFNQSYLLNEFTDVIPFLEFVSKYPIGPFINDNFFGQDMLQPQNVYSLCKMLLIYKYYIQKIKTNMNTFSEYECLEKLILESLFEPIKNEPDLNVKDISQIAKYAKCFIKNVIEHDDIKEIAIKSLKDIKKTSYFSDTKPAMERYMTVYEKKKPATEKFIDQQPNPQDTRKRRRSNEDNTTRKLRKQQPNSKDMDIS